ncbi:unnamed protein product [Calypogeia fissa]
MDAGEMAGLANVSDDMTNMEVEEGAGLEANGTIKQYVETSMEVERGPEHEENGAVKEVVGANMEVDESAEKDANGPNEEVLGDGVSEIEHKDETISMEESLLGEGNMRISEGDDNPSLITEEGTAGLTREEDSIPVEGLGRHAAVENGVESTNVNDEKANLSVEELVVKGRAPVKSEFLTTPGVRTVVPNGSVTSGNGVWDENKESRIVPEKKSKRQMKRERLLDWIPLGVRSVRRRRVPEAKKSTEGICAIVARTGDVKQCPYAANCRFNHDLEGYKAQKPPDLPGTCPSLDLGEKCSYGLACRFAGTHKEPDKNERPQERRSNMASDELNSLSKELQKLLWKNMGSYPKADAQLQAMGLMTKAFKMRKVAGQESGQAENEEAQEGSVGVRHHTDETSTQSALETGSSAPIDSNYAKEQGVEVTAGNEGSIGDVAEHLNKGPAESNHRVLSCITEVCSPPLKRLKSEGDSVSDNKHVDGCPSDNVEGKTVLDTLSKLDEEEDNTLGGPTGRVQTKVEIGSCTPSNDVWRSLHVESRLGSREKKIIDFRNKLYLAPLTTVGNLPFRRVCKGLGADITCGEMAMCTNLLQGQASEWALLRRHSCEDVFGVQICGSFPDHVARTAELIEQECAVDFIDINMGCPIDLVVNKGSGSCLLTKPQKLEQVVRVTAAVMENPLTVKVRMGYYEGRNCAHSFMPNLSEWGVSAVTIHGRTRQQRYSKQADWAYVQQCVAATKGELQVIGNGDVFAYTDWTEHLENSGSKLSTCMIARGALIKPWLFREIKERRHWDISSGERLDILRQYVHCGLAHWGSDSKGVETTRHFLLEWLSYMHQYIPVGLLEVVPQRLNWRPPSYFGRNDLETMMASESAADWVRITELLLGPTPANFSFNPKHKSNAYDKPENG